MDRTALKLRGISLILLAVITFATFWPVLGNGFIKYDDSQYITENPRVLNGLTWANVAWAFRSGYASNWHPLTWLSHMLDVQLFGRKPFGHHLTNLLFHTANSLLLFLLLNRMTGAVGRSFFVAGFFALHPLHVESVAWAAERKDVLSTFFFMLTLLAYVWYAQQTGAEGHEFRGQGPEAKVQTRTLAETLRPFHGKAGRAYVFALICLALGLMSKPMLVTTPFVLLLLDYWPLQRLRLGRAAPSGNAAVLILEKVPFLVLVLFSSVVTFLAQEKSQALMAALPLLLRVANAITSYAKYLGKTFWPAHLAIFYPHPDLRFFSPHTDRLYPACEQWPAWQIIAAAALLLALSFLFVVRRHQQPWLLVGWFWFLGTLVPVIGIVQVGTQAMADRYTYIPLIGIFILSVWTAGALVSGNSIREALMGCVGVLLVGLCIPLAQRQISYWRDNYTVFSHALAMTSPNAVAEFNIGAGFLERKQYGLAQAHLRAALTADPNYGEAYAGLGYLFEALGKPQLALEQFHAALRLRPWDDLSRCHIASILEGLGRRDEAIAQYQEALRLNPDNVMAHYYLGAALCERGELEAGASQCAQALRLKPDFTDALLCLADATSRQGKLAEAETALRQLVRLHPLNPELRINLASLLWRQGRPDDAIEQYATAIRLNPQESMAYYDLGTVLAAQNKLSEAVTRFAEAIRLRPDYFEARLALGRTLAKQRKFSEAAAALEEAVRLSPSNALLHLDLANVLMSTGQTNQATRCFSNAFRLDPDLPHKLNLGSGSSQ